MMFSRSGGPELSKPLVSRGGQQAHQSLRDTPQAASCGLVLPPRYVCVCLCICMRRERFVYAVICMYVCIICIYMCIVRMYVCIICMYMYSICMYVCIICMYVCLVRMYMCIICMHNA